MTRKDKLTVSRKEFAKRMVETMDSVRENETSKVFVMDNVCVRRSD